MMMQGRGKANRMFFESHFILGLLLAFVSVSYPLSVSELHWTFDRLMVVCTVSLGFTGSFRIAFQFPSVRTRDTDHTFFSHFRFYLAT